INHRLINLLKLFSTFFFQAEDGIRDFHVTGVQTCALPISTGDEFENGGIDLWSLRFDQIEDVGGQSTPPMMHDPDCGIIAVGNRSEERRVGKECSSCG